MKREEISVRVGVTIGDFIIDLVLFPLAWCWPRVRGPYWRAGPFLLVLGNDAAIAPYDARGTNEGDVDAPPPRE